MTRIKFEMAYIKSMRECMVSDKEIIKNSKTGFKAWTPYMTTICVNCGLSRGDHSNGKCYRTDTYFESNDFEFVIAKLYLNGGSQNVQSDHDAASEKEEVL